MAVVSSIQHHDITNDFNDGANSLKNFLLYAEGVSKGNEPGARRVLENLNPLSRKALSPMSRSDAVMQGLAAALRSRGYVVDLNVGQSKFRCDLAVRGKSDSLYQLGILVDTDAHYAGPNLLDRYVMQPSILRAFGWRFALVLTKDWYHNPDDVLTRLERLLQGVEAEELPAVEDERPANIVPAAVEKNSVETVPGTSPPLSPELLATRAADVSESSVKPPPVAAPATVGPVRRIEFIGGSSQKFWEISVAGNSFTVRFGRIGTAGQSQTKTFADEAKARREAEKLSLEKVKKGYVEEAE